MEAVGCKVGVMGPLIHNFVEQADRDEFARQRGFQYKYEAKGVGGLRSSYDEDPVDNSNRDAPGEKAPGPCFRPSTKRAVGKARVGGRGWGRQRGV